MNQGASWTAITLPGVSSWSNFDFAYYLKQRSVTADRVLSNTFYLYYPGNGVFKTTNGGANWTNVKSGYIEGNSSYSGFNSTISSVPGHAGNLFYTSGWLTGSTASSPINDPFYRSTDGGATWTAVPNVLNVSCFGFSAARRAIIQQSTSSVTSTTHSAYGSQLIIHIHGRIWVLIRQVRSTQSAPSPAIRTITARFMLASAVAATPIFQQQVPDSRHPMRPQI